MEIVEVSSFSEYVDFVEQISPQYSLSRGQEKDKDFFINYICLFDYLFISS